MICAVPLGRQLVIQDISLHPDRLMSGDYANGSHHERHYSDHLTFEQTFAIHAALAGPTCAETRRIALSIHSIEAPTLSKSPSQVLE